MGDAPKKRRVTTSTDIDALKRAMSLGINALDVGTSLGIGIFHSGNFRSNLNNLKCCTHVGMSRSVVYDIQRILASGKDVTVGNWCVQREAKTQLAQRRAQLNATDGLSWGQRTATRRGILREAISTSLGTITIPKCAAWYSHTNGYYLPCLQGVDLLQ